MMDIIQIYKSSHTIQKSSYDTAARKRVGAWKECMSKSGYLKDGIVNLPLESKNDPTIKNADLIIILDNEDINPFRGGKPIIKSAASLKSAIFRSIGNMRMMYKSSVYSELKGFTILSKPWSFEIFEFQKISEECYGLWLNYTYDLGIPERESHKIAEIKKGKSIRYKINWVTNSTPSGRRKQRIYFEFDYVIEYVGSAAKIEFKDMNKIEMLKTIASGECKLIDERVILY